jgi:DNA repair exonuclease SbcCD ATPase subunit
MVLNRIEAAAQKVGDAWVAGENAWLKFADQPWQTTKDSIQAVRESKAWDRAKHWDMPGTRWVARWRANVLASRINDKVGEIDAIQRQVGKGPGTDAQRDEQIQLVMKVQKYEARRAKYGRFLADHYGKKLEKKQQGEGPEHHIDRYKARHETQNANLAKAEKSLERLETKSREFTQRWQNLIQSGKFDAATLQALSRDIAAVQQRIEDRKGRIAEFKEKRQSAANAIATWNERYAAAEQRIDQYKKMAVNGRFGTDADPTERRKNILRSRARQQTASPSLGGGLRRIDEVAKRPVSPDAGKPQEGVDEQEIGRVLQLLLRNVTDKNIDQMVNRVFAEFAENATVMKGEVYTRQEFESIWNGLARGSKSGMSAIDKADTGRLGDGRSMTLSAFIKEMAVNLGDKFSTKDLENGLRKILTVFNEGLEKRAAA